MKHKTATCIITLTILLMLSFDTCHGENTTFYMRSDAHTIHNITAYKLASALTTNATSYSLSQLGSYNVTFGVRIWTVNSRGQLFEITQGSPVATVTRTTDGQGVQQGTFNYQGQSSIADAILLRIYVMFGNNAPQLVISLITSNGLTCKIAAGTWTVQYYTQRTYTAGQTVATLRWGNTTYNMNITLNLTTPSRMEVMQSFLQEGNLVQFILYPYTSLVGNSLFFGFVLLFMAVTLYMEVQNAAAIAIMLALFTAGTGFLSVFIPEIASPIFFVALVICIAVLLYKLVKR